MKRTPSIAVVDAPTLSLVLDDLFYQAQMIGLATAYFGAPRARDVSEVVLGRYAIIRDILRAGEHVFGPLVVPGATPILFNNEEWSASRRSGFATVDTKASELVLTYAGGWGTYLMEEHTFVPRLLKATFDCIRHDRTCDAGVRFLLALLNGGFIFKESDFAEAATLVIQCVSSFEDDQAVLTWLNSVPATFTDRTSRALQEFVGEIVQAQTVVPKRLHLFYSELTKTILNQFAIARSATAAAEWVVSFASLSALLTLYFQLFHANEDLLSGTLADSAVRSQFEEIRADLGAYARVTATRPAYAPFVHNPALTVAVWASYQSKYPDRWLRKLRADRLLIPDALALIIESRWADSPNFESLRAMTWPCEWTQFSEILAFPLAVPLGQNPFLMRTRLFDEATIKPSCRSLPCVGSFSDKDLDVILFREYYRKFDFQRLLTHGALAYDHEVVRVELHGIHRQLVEQEVRNVFKPCIVDYLRVTPTESLDLIARLTAFLDLYPWFAPAHQEMAIHLDRIGRQTDALKSFRTALRLQPDNPQLWKSVGYVCSELGQHREGEFCEAVSALLREGKVL